MADDFFTATIVKLFKEVFFRLKMRMSMQTQEEIRAACSGLSNSLINLQERVEFLERHVTAQQAGYRLLAPAEPKLTPCPPGSGDAVEPTEAKAEDEGGVREITLPGDPIELEEANFPPELVGALAGQSVLIRVLPEEAPGTRRARPGENPILIDRQGDCWNDYHPVQVLYPRFPI